MHIQAYLFFDGRCEEALEFYRAVLGAEITTRMYFRDNPDAEGAMVAPEMQDKIMHASFRIGDSTLMASDGQCLGQANFRGFSLTLSVADAEAADRLFAALGDGGQIQMPMAETFFSPRFGMIADRFGVSWMILTESP
jgi:PhnB protein